MTDFLANLNSPALGLISGSLLTVWAMVLFPRSNRKIMGPGDPGIVALQLSRTPERMVEVLRAWVDSKGPSAIRELKKQLAGLDTVFPLIYATFLGWALASVWPTGATQWLIALPAKAALADWLENASLLIAIRRLPPLQTLRIPNGSALAAAIFAALKFLLLLATIVLIAIGALT